MGAAAADAVLPVLHVLAGPNGAGKTTFYERVLGPATGLEFINADLIAASRWPDDRVARSYEAAQIASALRAERLRDQRSFITETVFSHESKVALLADAKQAGYTVMLHVVLVPADLAVVRVASRVAQGGHHVPEDKIRERFVRLFPLLVMARGIADETSVYDNTRAAHPFQLLAAYNTGHLIDPATWPDWVPKSFH